MAYLSRIVSAVESHFQIKICGDYYPKTLINSIRFADENDAEIAHLTPNILYLADYRKFKEKELYGDVLFINCGTPVPQKDGMYIREDVNLFELYNVISDSLMNYQRIRLNEETLFNMLFSGRGLLKLLQTAYNVLDNPITVLDSSFSTIAYYPDVDEPLFELKNKSLILNHKVLSNMKNSNIIDHIYHSVYPFKTAVDGMDHEMIFESIRIQRAVVGYICVRCSNRDISSDELEYIHSLTQMISIQLHQNETYQNPYGIKYDLFLKHLFTNHYDSEESIKRQLALLNVQPRKDYYIIASGFCEKSARLMANEYYCSQLSHTFLNSITGMRGDCFITLVSTDEFPYFTPAVLERFESFLNMNKMKASVSYVFHTLLDAQNYLEQCSSQLNHFLVAYTERPVGFYSDHYLRHLVEQSGNYDVQKATIHPAILQMADFDKKNQTNYIETLITYFKQNRNAPATAKALFIHKSTLFYRFSKMNALFQIDFEDSKALFDYEFSLYLMEILESREQAHG